MSPSSRRRILDAIVASTVLALGVTRADAAEDLFVALEYDMGSKLVGCPEASEFKRIVSDQLGYDPFREGATRRVIVRANAAERGLEGDVEWQGADGSSVGERKFSSRTQDCAELTKTMSFAVAVQIQLLDTTLPPPSKASSEPAPPAVSTATSGATPHPSTTPHAPATVASEKVGEARAPSPPSTRLSFAFGVGPSVAVGLGPSPNFEGRIFGDVRFGPASLELGAEASTPTTLELPDGSGFSQYRLALSLAGCGHLDRWSACIVGKLGQIRAQGLGVDAAFSPTGTTTEAGLRIAMTQNLVGPVYVLARVDGLGQLTPWTITINQTDVWTSPRFAATAGIDLALRFR